MSSRLLKGTNVVTQQWPDKEAASNTTTQPREAETKIDEMQRDAARYRWLKTRLMGADLDWAGSGSLVIVFKMPSGSSVSENCDQTIDAAMSKSS